jgi:hypothetical protein
VLGLYRQKETAALARVEKCNPKEECGRQTNRQALDLVQLGAVFPAIVVLGRAVDGAKERSVTGRNVAVLAARRVYQLNSTRSVRSNGPPEPALTGSDRFIPPVVAGAREQ